MLLVVVGAVALVVVVVLEASVPAVEGSGQGGAFHLNVHPVAAGTDGKSEEEEHRMSRYHDIMIL